MNYEGLDKKIHRLASTRVWRTYSGGRELEKWKLEPNASDGEFPEEWVASIVNARNPGRERIPDEGLSRIDPGNSLTVTLKEVIESNPAGFLGPDHYKRFGMNMGLLVKLIDSCERLTIQVHPDKQFARQVFNSDYGKTEAWFILGGRCIDGEEPYVLLGFKPGMTKDKWREIFLRQDVSGMLDALNKIYIKPGEVYFIEAGVPHAIGPGCFLAEIQEPTDYTLRVERRTPRGKEIPDTLCHQGAGFDKLFECFHYDMHTLDEVLAKWRISPSIVAADKCFVEQVLIGKEHTDLFEMRQLTVYSEYDFIKRDMFSTLIFLKGNGKIRSHDFDIEVAQGDMFFVPASVNNFRIEVFEDSALEILCCFPPIAK